MAVQDLTCAGVLRRGVVESWSSGVWTAVGSRAMWMVEEVVDCPRIHLAENAKVDGIGIEEFNSASITYASLTDPKQS